MRRRGELQLGMRTVAYEWRGRDVIAIDGVAHAVDLRQGQGGAFSCLVDNKAIQVHVDDLSVDGERLAHRFVTSADAVCGRAATDAEIRAPMPGRVVAVLVRERDSVLQGAGLVVVEAMKMENELVAPCAGTVAEIAVAAGAAVEAGALLVRIVAAAS
jgi:biotin carboxyl carrier protein